MQHTDNVRAWRSASWLMAVINAILLVSEPAQAHTASRSFVLLLPTKLIIICGALSVLMSFVALLVLRDESIRGKAAVFAPHKTSFLMSISQTLSLVALLALIVIGFAGSRDPLGNPLPLVIWTFWWVIMVLFHAVVGNAWTWLNPLTPVSRIANALGTRPRTLPKTAASAMCLMLFAAFAWWQLVYVTPEDPTRLATLVSVYLAFSFLGINLFGTTWVSTVDPFHTIFSWLSACAPLAKGDGWQWRWPGWGLAQLPAFSRTQLALLIMLLATLSFDALANSFFWFQVIGENPLDFQGRGSVMGRNTLGLLASMAVLAAVVFTSIVLGWLWAGKPKPLLQVMQALALSLLPISVALHFAHFLPDTIVNGQYLLKSLGLYSGHVSASMLNTAFGATLVYAAQATAVVGGHMVAVAVARRAIALMNLPHQTGWKLEAPFALLMVAYTGFSLWLLSTATVG